MLRFSLVTCYSHRSVSWSYNAAAVQVTLTRPKFQDRNDTDLSQKLQTSGNRRFDALCELTDTHIKRPSRTHSHPDNELWVSGTAG